MSNVEGTYKRLPCDRHLRVHTPRSENARVLVRRAADGRRRARENVQGAINPNLYRANQTWYPMGHGLVFMYTCIGLISTVTLRFLFKAENAR